MSERTEYPPGVPCWVTCLARDPEAAAAFYADLLGWRIAPTGGFLTATLRGKDVAAIAPLPAGIDAGAWITQVSTDSAEAVAERAREAGGTVLAEPFEEPKGRITVIADPNGGVLSAKEPGTRAGAQLVNEPGAWAMSSLGTPDPDAAASFYGAAFGWTTEAFGEATLFRLPGYVGGGPEQPVSREVVAAMIRREGPVAWVPDFWLKDLDAALAKVPTVHAGPFEQPPGRTAVVADPEGTVFSLSEIVLDR